MQDEIKDTIKFTVNDAHGEPHSYEVTPHPPDEGTRFALTVSATGGEALGRLITNKNLSALLDAWEGGKISLDGDIGQLRGLLEDMGELNLGAMVADLRSVIAANGDADFLKAILKHAFRDGERITSATYNQWYARNYRELFEAAFRVIKANGFLVFGGIS